MKETRQFIWTYIKIIFALFILGVAINMFLGPHHIAAGGVSGLGILLEAALGFDRAIVILVLNIVMLVLALLFLGIICQIKRDKTFHLRNSKKLLMVFGNLVIF